MATRISSRLAVTYLTIVFVIMSALGLLISYSVEHQFIREARATLESHGELLRNQIAGSLRDDLQPGELDNACRAAAVKINAHVSIHGSDGLILGDSESSPQDIHFNLPESMKGMRQGWGCRICHTEARNPKSLAVEVPITRGDPPKEVAALILSASLYEASRAAAKARRIVFITLALSSIIIGVTTLRLAGSMTEPLRRMNRMAKMMATGDLGARVHASGMDEIGELAESLNDMADRLRSNLDQLAQERDKFATVLATMADAIVVTDKAGIVTLINHASERLFGVAAEEIIGREVESLTAVPEIPELIRRTLSGGNLIRHELETTVPAERVINFYCAPAHDHKGEIAASVSVIQDITETRRLAEIRKDFVANVSHELRTPVASIRAITGALESGALEDPEAARRFLDNLDAESARLSELLNDLLNISELESGKARLKRKEFEFKTIVEQVISQLGDKARRSGIELMEEVPEGLTIYANKRQMTQVLLNLVDNAVKYTPEGGSVTITGQETDTETCFSVTDTGVGIPPRALDRIFERFYRVDKARSRQLGGTGLGLSIVKDIVEAHDGRIMVDSRPDIGSTFMISLPKAPESPDSV